jgi:hypothetical protein
MLTQVVQTRSPRSATAEPRLVIEHREALIYMICDAAELEHGLMCEYAIRTGRRDTPRR